MTRYSGTTTGLSAPQVLVPIATGSEEIETCCIVDTLVRGGAKVTVASVEDRLTVVCSRGVKITADVDIRECGGTSWDLVVIPGGMPGAQRLRDSKPLAQILAHQHAQVRLIGAICAAPAVVLEPMGITAGKVRSFSSHVPCTSP